MQAQRFGYAVSPSAAIDVGTTSDHLADRKRRGRRRFRTTLLVLAVMCGGAGAWAASEGRPDWIPAALPLLLALPVGLVAGCARELYVISSVTRWVNRGPWQAWPCRMEELPDKPHLRRILMLGPDGTVARELWSEVPVPVWLDRTDGLGLLWFCGDLRFGGVFAEPGGAPVWRARPAEPGKELHAAPAAPASGGENVLLTELTRQAASTVFGRLLGG
ncbi:hypothetical protein [Streptomyces sp. NPDC001744]|uniref:hypothetical protein n=1 Tax=Streptomyces sp. NPDC001744 TaxID=3364606 RepID=UPI0036CFA7E6